MDRIPFTKPSISQRDARFMMKAFSENNLGGNGVYTKLAEDSLSKMLNIKYVYLTTSATHALEMAVMCLGIGPGDEVICPSFTFVSTANAIIRQGAFPRFCEIDPNTLNIDIDEVEKCITKNTKAIMPVHYGGISCDMDALMKLASRYGLRVIEDGAQAIGALYKDKPLCTIGDIGALSFHITKNITCGEGGAFLTNSEHIAKTAEVIREKGTDRAKFLKGKVDRYTWVNVGSSFIPSDLLAAILLGQLKKLRSITANRVKIFRHYYDRLKSLEMSGSIKLPVIPSYATMNGHVFWMLAKSERHRDSLMKALNGIGVSATFHYIPLHSSPYGRGVLKYRKGDLPITENIAKRLIRLPLFAGLTIKEVDFICDNVSKFIRKDA